MSDEFEIDPLEYRNVLGHFPTGVTVVTAIDADGNPAGIAIGSFFSISLDPPLVGFCVGRDSRSWGAISTSEHFMVNVLADTQLNDCGQIAGGSDDKWNGIAWEPAAISGTPKMTGSLAHIECKREDSLDGGDHEIVVGRVVSLEATGDETQRPLVFFRGGYGTHAEIG